MRAVVFLVMGNLDYTIGLAPSGATAPAPVGCPRMEAVMGADPICSGDEALGLLLQSLAVFMPRPLRLAQPTWAQDGFEVVGFGSAV